MNLPKMEICCEEEMELSLPIPPSENGNIEIAIENYQEDIPLPIFLKVLPSGSLHDMN